MQVPSTLCWHSMPVVRAARWFSGVTTSLCCQVSPFPPARNRTAIPALGALIPNTSCATHLLHEGLYMLSAQLAAWFAGSISIAAVVKAGSCSEGSHNPDGPTLLCWTLVCQRTPLFAGMGSYSAATLELGLIATPRQISLHFNSTVLSCALSSTWRSQLIIKQVFNHLNPLET